MSRDTVRIATAQLQPERLATLDLYRKKLAHQVEEAARAGAELLVFPEYGAMEWAGVLGPHDLDQGLALVAEAMPEMDAFCSALAGQHRVHILAASGPAMRGDGSIVNAARLFAPTGAVGVQEKLIMTPFEHRWGISAGGPCRVFETTLGMIGIAICYDSEFPLLVRAQVEAGARIMLIPSCTEFSSGHARIRAAAMARALENTCYTVVSPTVGEARWSPAIDVNVGAAGIFAPADNAHCQTGVIVEGAVNAPGWVYGEVHLSPLETLVVSGEMRNRSDWERQPGAAPLKHKVDVQSLL